MENKNSIKIMAVASGGGHWVQLLKLLPAFRSYKKIFVTVDKRYKSDVTGETFFSITDATRWNKLKMLLLLLQIFMIILIQKPKIIITTGAAPGYISLRIGKLFRCKTIWVDSIANCDKLSLSGKLAGPFADLWITQWPHLDCENGPRYYGAVL
jgi:UDP-N-acetylglucosamine:LPS N-acetylglucosamine transferase